MGCEKVRELAGGGVPWAGCAPIYYDTVVLYNETHCLYLFAPQAYAHDVLCPTAGGYTASD